jgi:hypothetical protein
MTMLFSIAISLLMLSSCATTQPKSPIQQVATLPHSRLNPELFGRWKGVHKEKSRTRTWHMDRYENGVFHMTNFVGKTVLNEEFGLWSADSKKYSTTTLGFIEGSEMVPDLISETYDIQKLNKDLFEYKNSRTGNTFRVSKISNPIEIPPSDKFSKTPLSAEVFAKTQLVLIDLLRLLETNQPTKAYELFCKDQIPSKEVFEKSLETMNAVYGLPQSPHFIKLAMAGAKVTTSKVHPVFSFWVRSQFHKPNTFIRTDISYFDSDTLCVLTYSPVNFADDKIPPDLR